MSDEKPSYYAILTAEVRYDKRLKPNEKLLFAEITALSNKNGYCHAGNSYFAGLFDVSKTTVSRWISHLSELGLVHTKLFYKKNTKQVIKRIISLTPIDKKINTYTQKSHTPIDKKSKVNTTSINNTRKVKDRIYNASKSKDKNTDKSLVSASEIMKNMGWSK